MLKTKLNGGTIAMFANDRHPVIIGHAWPETPSKYKNTVAERVIAIPRLALQTPSPARESFCTAAWSAVFQSPGPWWR